MRRFFVVIVSLAAIAAIARANAQSVEKYERTQPPKAQPVAPKKPAAVKPPATAPAGRTSTFEVGVAYGNSGNEFSYKYVDDARVCQSLCLAAPQCVAWYFIHDTKAGAYRYCGLQNTMVGQYENPPTTAGVVR